MRDYIRLYEIANQLGLGNRPVLEAAEALRIQGRHNGPIKSHSSAVTLADAQRIADAITSTSHWPRLIIHPDGALPDPASIQRDLESLLQELK